MFFQFFLNLLAELVNLKKTERARELELELIMSFGKSFQIFIHLYQREFLRIFVRA